MLRAHIRGAGIKDTDYISWKYIWIFVKIVTGDHKNRSQYFFRGPFVIQ